MRDGRPRPCKVPFQLRVQGFKSRAFRVLGLKSMILGLGGNRRLRLLERFRG